MQSLPSRRKIIWPDKTVYFLTSSTFLHYPYFKTSEQKQIVLNQIKLINKSLDIPILAFSISINHFHLKFYLRQGNLMTKVKNLIHSGISREHRRIYASRFPQFWHSSRVLRAENEEMSWKVTGYIIGNLLKHRELSTFEELKNCPFSSYCQTVQRFGEEIAMNAVHGVINVPENAEGVVNLEGLSACAIKPPA